MPISLHFSMALVLSTICLAAPAWADFQAGMKAYLSGDYATALREWRPLAEQGNISAQVFLGDMYYLGNGVSRDYSQARHWYEKAAAQGHIEAQYRLGEMYENGKGLPQDYAHAHKWYNLALANGYPRGAKSRDELAKKMTPEQIAEAQKLAREWKPTKK